MRGVAVFLVCLVAQGAWGQYGAPAARRPQKVWTTTPFPDEIPPSNNDIYQPQSQPSYQPSYPQTQPQPQPAYRPQPQPAYQPQPAPQPSYQQPQPAPQPSYQQPQPQQPQGGNYWWTTGSRPFSPQATGPAPVPQQPPISQGNPFLSGRPQSPAPSPQGCSGGGGYGGGGGCSGGAPAPSYVPCNQPGQGCVPIGQCNGGFAAPGAQDFRPGQCNSQREVCCRQSQPAPPPPPQPQPPAYGGGYNAPAPLPPRPQPAPQIPRPQPQQPSYGGGYQQPQQTYQPQPTPGPYTGPLNTTPYPGCAAALKCVEQQYCDMKGVMSNAPVYLTREQQENQVALSECQNPETGIIGKCCRDPNYKDPWPGGMMMKNMPTGPSGPGPLPPQGPPPPPPQPLQDTCANAGGVCVPSQQCPGQSRVQPEQGCYMSQGGTDAGTGAAAGVVGVCCEEPHPYNEEQDDNDQSANPSFSNEANIYYNQPTTPRPSTTTGKPTPPPAPAYVPRSESPAYQPTPQSYPQETTQPPAPQSYAQVAPQPRPQQPATPQSHPQAAPEQPAPQSYPQAAPQPRPQQPAASQSYPQQPAPQSYAQAAPQPRPQQPATPQSYPQAAPEQPAPQSYPQATSQPRPQQPAAPQSYPQQPAPQSYAQAAPQPRPQQPAPPQSYPQQPAPQPAPQSYAQAAPQPRPQQPAAPQSYPQQPAPQSYAQAAPQPRPQQPATPQSYPQAAPQQPAAPQSYPQTAPQQPAPQSYPQASPQPRPVSPAYPQPSPSYSSPTTPQTYQTPQGSYQQTTTSSPYNTEPTQPAVYLRTTEQPTTVTQTETQPTSILQSTQTTAQSTYTTEVAPRQEYTTRSTPEPTQSTPEPSQESPQPSENAQPNASPGSACGTRRQVPHPSNAPPGQAAPGEFPWQALVVSRNNQTAICSGSVLSRDAILTAAHCLHGLEAGDIQVKAGSVNMGMNEPDQQTSGIAAIAKHPKFEPTSLFYDQAVLRLSEPFTLNDKVDTLCIPGDDLRPEAGEQCIATGWGLQVIKGNQVGAHLNAVPARVMSTDEAERHLQRTFLGPHFKLHESVTCATATVPYTSLCMVDPGSTLACPLPEGSYAVAGVYSWDVGCHPSMVSAPEGPQAPTAFSILDAPWVRSVMNAPIQDLVEAGKNELLRKQQQEKQPEFEKPGFNQGYGK